MNVSLRGDIRYTPNRQNTAIQFLGFQSDLILRLYIHQVETFKITCPRYKFLSPSFILFVFVVVSCMLNVMLHLSLVDALWPLCLHSFRTFFRFSPCTQSERSFNNILVVAIHCSLRVLQSLLYLYMQKLSSLSLFGYACLHYISFVFKRDTENGTEKGPEIVSRK